MVKVVLVTAGEERLPEGTGEAIRGFADFRAARCETPEDLLRTFPDAEVCWMFGPNLCLKPEGVLDVRPQPLSKARGARQDAGREGASKIWVGA